MKSRFLHRLCIAATLAGCAAAWAQTHFILTRWPGDPSTGLWLRMAGSRRTCWIVSSRLSRRTLRPSPLLLFPRVPVRCVIADPRRAN